MFTEGEPLGETNMDYLKPDIQENDFLENAKLCPPQDPEKVDTLEGNLILSKERVIFILEEALHKILDWLADEKL